MEGFAAGSLASWPVDTDATAGLIWWPKVPQPGGCHYRWPLAWCGQWAPCFVGGGGTYCWTGPRTLRLLPPLGGNHGSLVMLSSCTEGLRTYIRTLGA